MLFKSVSHVSNDHTRDVLGQWEVGNTFSKNTLSPKTYVQFHVLQKVVKNDHPLPQKFPGTVLGVFALNRPQIKTLQKKSYLAYI